MTDKEFEKIVKKGLQINTTPDRVHFAQTLSKIKELSVTKSEDLRYNSKTASPSNIINNKFANFMFIWKSKHMVLVPSLILLIFIGAFSLSGQTGKYNLSIEQLAQQDATLEELDFIDEDEAILNDIDEQYIDESSTIEYEL